jgi:hypothetical protein
MRVTHCIIRAGCYHTEAARPRHANLSSTALGAAGFRDSPQFEGVASTYLRVMTSTFPAPGGAEDFPLLVTQVLLGAEQLRSLPLVVPFRQFL